MLYIEAISLVPDCPHKIINFWEIAESDYRLSQKMRENDTMKFRCDDKSKPDIWRSSSFNVGSGRITTLPASSAETPASSLFFRSSIERKSVRTSLVNISS